MEKTATAAAITAAPSVHVLLIPFLGRSRALTMTATACLLAKHGGLRCTIVTTPSNSSYILPAIEKLDNVELQLVPFPAADVGLPVGFECTDVLSKDPHSMASLYQGMKLLRHPVETLIVDLRPDIIVFDLLLFWYGDVATSHSIPFFILDTLSPFQTAVFNQLIHVGHDAHPLRSDMIGPLTKLPHPFEFTTSEVPALSAGYSGLSGKLTENFRRSSGILANTFEELTPQYVQHCSNFSTVGQSKLWCIGPMQLVNDLDHTAAAGGGNNMIIKTWLDSKRPESVVYVSFGSECVFSPEQLREIAIGLQSCEHSFVWVVRGKGGGAETMDEWLPEEFRNSVGERGLIVTKWAPQFAILNHPAICAFVTHCGWRSTLEALCAGLPVIPWPLHSEQFMNEKLLVEILRVGVRFLEGPNMRSIDVKGKGLVKGSLIKNAVDQLLDGTNEEARAMRQKANKYKELARSAMAKGGSSYANLNHVIDKMKILAMAKQAIVKS